MEKKYPKFLKKLFHLTKNDERIPTDFDLDVKIEELKFYMHYVWPMFIYVVKKKIWFSFRYKWRKLLSIFVITLIISTLSYLSWIKVAKPVFVIKQQNDLVQNIHSELIASPIPKENLIFMDAVSALESRHNYKSVNGQYWGAFQVGELARKEIGIQCMSYEMFINDIIIQNWAMNKLMQVNYEYLRETIIKYNIPRKGGIVIGNNLITVSGLLAGAHLVGASAAKRFIESNGKEIPKDGNGIPITKNLQLNNFDLVLK
jgi:hypothetical protein